MLFDSSSDNNSLCDVAIHKRYFNISTFSVLKILGYFLLNIDQKLGQELNQFQERSGLCL